MSDEIPRGGDLVTLPDDLPPSKYADEASFLAVSAGSSFLPRLMLYGSNSDVVKEGKVSVGYCLVEGKDSYTELGREVDVLNIAWRTKALDMSGERVIANHDHTSEQFKAIAHKADNVTNPNCVYGPEYLVWIPSVQKFATFLMGSKTARREAPKMQALLKRAATLKTKLFDNGKYKWHGSEVHACSTPFVDMPDPEALLDTVTRFNNPPASEVVEEVKPEETTARPR